MVMVVMVVVVAVVHLMDVHWRLLGGPAVRSYAPLPPPVAPALTRNDQTTETCLARAAASAGVAPLHAGC